MTKEKNTTGIWAEIFKPTLVLMLIATVMGVLLTFTYNAAGVEAVANAGLKEEELAAVIGDVLPGGSKLVQVKEASSSDKAVNSFYKDEGGAGYAVYVSVTGYKEDLKMLIGIASDGTISGASAISHNETPGIGTKALDPAYLQKFVGLSAPITVAKSGGSVDAIAGATYTSSGVGDAMNRALAAYEEAKGVLGGE